MVFGSFQRSSAGWRSFERSKMVGDTCERYAKQIVSAANSAGTSTYSARQVQDRGGRNNTLRAAAEVYTPNSSFEDARNRTLRTIAYEFRGRRQSS